MTTPQEARATAQALREQAESLEEDWPLQCHEVTLGARMLTEYAALLERQAQHTALTEEEILDALTKVDIEAVRLPPGMKAFARALEQKIRNKS